MAEITVRSLAKQIKKSVEETLSAIQGAGLAHTNPDDVLSRDDIGVFLRYKKSGKVEPVAVPTVPPNKVSTEAVDDKESGEGADPKKKSARDKRPDAAKTTPSARTGSSAAPKKKGASSHQGAAAGKHGHTKAKTAATGRAEEETKHHPPRPDKKRVPKRAYDFGMVDVSIETDELDVSSGGSKSGVVAKPQTLQPQVLKVEGRHQGFHRPTAQVVRTIKFADSQERVLVRDVARQMAVKTSVLMAALEKAGVSPDEEGNIDRDTAVLITEEMGHRYTIVRSRTAEQLLEQEDSGVLEPRPAVVTVMGHVDHGKTSLLDYIRRTRVVAGEAGGITQHIGAYCVDTPKGRISFIDTPGHAAFSAMRARGASCTDVVVLVVAADDGVQPQTREAIQHTRSAGVPMVVAISKTDLEQANVDKVRQELVAEEVVPESLGGDVQLVEMSVVNGKGVDSLLEAVLLQAEVLDLKAVGTGPASGVVLESSSAKGKGTVATLLVQKGQLKVGDMVVTGVSCGKVRGMSDDRGAAVKTAVPSTPVEILGLDGLADAGAPFSVVKNERTAREVVATRTREMGPSAGSAVQPLDAGAMMEALVAGKETRALNVVLRADTQGVLEAISAGLGGLGDENSSVRILFSGVGGITESDVHLALDGALIIGFNVRASAQARKQAAANSVDIRYYSIIYELLEDAAKMLKDMMPPEIREEIVGIAKVLEIFRSPRFGRVAGCVVTEGVVRRGNPIRVLRDNTVIYEGELDSLRRFKSDVDTVREGTECGIGVKNYDNVKADDQIEVYSRTVIKADSD